MLAHLPDFYTQPLSVVTLRKYDETTQKLERIERKQFEKTEKARKREEMEGRPR